MAKKPVVWISHALTDASLTKGFRVNMSVENPNIEDPDEIMNAARKSMAGEGLPQECFARQMKVSNKHDHQKRLPDICLPGGYPVVSAECAAVLRRFDLGDGNLYPLELYQYNGKTRVEGEYFHLNFGAQKDSLLVDQSQRLDKPYDNVDVWDAWLSNKDGEIALSPAALEGPDLWVEVRLRRAFFLSDPLAQALKAAKLTRRFKLRKCLIAEAS